MMEQRMMMGPRTGKGMRAIRAQKPTSGKLRTSRITFPMYMLAITAQTNFGFCWKSIGPGWGPDIMGRRGGAARAAPVGNQNGKAGASPLLDVVLFAPSGAATPSIAPL